MSRFQASIPALTLAALLALVVGCAQEESASDSAAAQAPAASWQEDPALPEPPEVQAYVGAENAFSDDPEGMDDPRVLEIRESAKLEVLKATEGTPEMVQTILQKAQAEPVLPAVQEEGIDALENLGWKGGQLDASVEAIGTFLQASEPRVRARAVEALDFLKSDRSTELLITALSDDHPQVRSAACSGLLLRVRPEHLEPVKQAYLKESDRAVKVDLWELLENIAIERHKARQGSGEGKKV